MRAIIFFMAIAGLIGFAYHLANNKSTDTTTMDVSLATGFSFSKKPIAPLEEWEDILIGKWEISTRFNFENIIEIFEGEVEYNPDGSFVRYITFKRFYFEYRFKENSPNIVAGGSISGTWEINDNSTWIEYPKKCNIKISYIENGYNVDVCKRYFSFKNGNIYGEKNTDTSKSELKEFNRSRISIVKKSFSTGKNDYFTFTSK